MELALPKYFDESLYNLKNSPIYAAPRDSAKEVRSQLLRQIGTNIIGLITKGQRFLETKTTISAGLHSARENAYFYPNSDGIEILDVEDNAVENELFLKDQKASIGFWDSRGKFQFY